MALSKERLRELAGEMAAAMGLPERPRPALRVVDEREFHSQPRTMDAVTRDAHMQRIRYLARGYNLRWLVDQATFDRPGLEHLEDHEIVSLHKDLDRAMECRRDGVSFEDAGLVRPLSRQEGAEDEVDAWGDPGFRLVG